MNQKLLLTDGVCSCRFKYLITFDGCSEQGVQTSYEA